MLQLAAQLTGRVCAYQHRSTEAGQCHQGLGVTREDVGIVESTTGPDGEANDAGLVCFNKSKLGVEPRKTRY